MQQDRTSARMDFARQVLGNGKLTSEVASADASFRSYYRVRDAARTWIMMDAPPGQEDVRPWLDIGARLRNAGLHAPEVFGADIAQGFVLMEDLGTRLYLPELNTASVDALYADALDALFRMQQQIDGADLPHFDTPRVIAEMELMPEWFLQRHLGLAADCGEWDVIENAFRALAQCAAEQPRCFMHRDYHSRNLLVVEPRKPPPDSWLPGPGIIDFQGAMLGPIAYDLASLLRDCYIAWPIERVDAWVETYRQRLATIGRIHVDGAHFRRWFDLIGLQRHIKVLGLFCRLWYRDGKAGYLDDLRLVLDYVVSVARLYPEFVDFSQLLQDAVGSGDVTRPRAAA